MFILLYCFILIVLNSNPGRRDAPVGNLNDTLTNDCVGSFVVVVILSCLLYRLVQFSVTVMKY